MQTGNGSPATRHTTRCISTQLCVNSAVPSSDLNCSILIVTAFKGSTAACYSASHFQLHKNYQQVSGDPTWLIMSLAFAACLFSAERDSKLSVRLENSTTHAWENVNEMYVYKISCYKANSMYSM